MKENERYTIDTVAVLGYLADRLPSRADRVFQKAEDGRAELVVPSITLGETLYTLLKGKEVFGVRIPMEKLSVFYDVVESRGSLSKPERIERCGEHCAPAASRPDDSCNPQAVGFKGDSNRRPRDFGSRRHRNHLVRDQDCSRVAERTIGPTGSRANLSAKQQVCTTTGLAGRHRAEL